MPDHRDFEPRDEFGGELDRRLRALAGESTPDLDDVAKGGRAYRKRSVLRRVSALVVIVGLVALGGPSALRSLRDDDARLAVTQGEIPDSRAATFALRAVAQAGLMNSKDDYYLSYEETQRTEGGWIAQFKALRCTTTPDVHTCNPIAGNGGRTPLEVTVVEGQLRVTGAPEDIPGDKRERLLAFAEAPDPIDPHPEHAPVVLRQGDPEADGESLIFSVASYWAGPLPDRVLTFGCFVRAYNDQGEVVYESHAHAYESPRSEERRTGGVLSSGFPAATNATRAEMICERFEGPGWTPERLDVSQKEGASSARVRGVLVWSERGISGVTLDCTVHVYDEGGNVIGQVDRKLSGPWPLASDTRPPFNQEIDLIVDVPADALATSADVACVLPSPPIDEPGDGADEGADFADDDNGPPIEGPVPASPPEGPRHVIATGTFDHPDWEEWQDAQWQLLAWAAAGWRCWVVEVDDHGESSESGRSCGYVPSGREDEIEDIGSSQFWPANMPIGLQNTSIGERSVLVAVLSQRVARVKVELSTGATYEPEVIVPDPSLGIEARYFFVELEPAEGYTIRAFDDSGRPLEDEAQSL